MIYNLRDVAPELSFGSECAEIACVYLLVHNSGYTRLMIIILSEYVNETFFLIIACLFK